MGILSPVDGFADSAGWPSIEEKIPADVDGQSSWVPVPLLRSSGQQCSAPYSSACHRPGTNVVPPSVNALPSL